MEIDSPSDSEWCNRKALPAHSWTILAHYEAGCKQCGRKTADIGKVWLLWSSSKQFRKAVEEKMVKRCSARRAARSGSYASRTAPFLRGPGRACGRGMAFRTGSGRSYLARCPALRPAQGLPSAPHLRVPFKLFREPQRASGVLAPAPRAARSSCSDWPQCLFISRDARVACRGPALFRKP